MAVDRAFNFGRVNVLAACDDHVLHAVVDIQIAILIQISGITRFDPAAIGHRPLGGVGQVPIADHVVR